MARIHRRCSKTASHTNCTVIAATQECYYYHRCYYELRERGYPVVPVYFAGYYTTWLVEMVRKLKYHEQKLLKKVDFISWKVDKNVREVQILKKYRITKREDYSK